MNTGARKFLPVSVYPLEIVEGLKMVSRPRKELSVQCSSCGTQLSPGIITCPFCGASGVGLKSPIPSTRAQWKRTKRAQRRLRRLFGQSRASVSAEPPETADSSPFETAVPKPHRKGFLSPMNAPSSSETAKPLQQFVTSHPWLFILALVVIVEVILLPISLLIKISLLSLRAPVQPIKYLIYDLRELSLVLVAFVFLSQLSWWRQTGFMKGIGRKDVLVCLFPTLPILFGALFVFPLLISGSVKISLGQLVLIAIFSCLIGVAEESLFRGLILQTLLPKGVLRAIFLSALVFALLHVANLFAGLSLGYVLGQVLNAFGVGIAFAVMRVRTGSIWPAIILHSLTDFNALVLITATGVGHPTLLFALLAGGIICSLYLIYAAIALRPSKLSELRTRYQPETRSSQVSTTSQESLKPA